MSTCFDCRSKECRGCACECHLPMAPKPTPLEKFAQECYDKWQANDVSCRSYETLNEFVARRVAEECLALAKSTEIGVAKRIATKFGLEDK